MDGGVGRSVPLVCHVLGKRGPWTWTEPEKGRQDHFGRVWMDGWTNDEREEAADARDGRKRVWTNTAGREGRDRE
ncbi:hypothetical protein LZ30DRAFT_724072 [Colletotrichum cereale]|nr:hypothetical protein LZ30DRAFT_724072 [Colletotrichum cereale]